MELKIIKLDLKTPLHLGDIGVDLLSAKNYWHSDGVFSAIFNALTVLYPKELDKIAAIFKKEVLISSAFPYIENKLFFPIFKIKFVEDEIYFEYRKKIKKLQFISLNYFERLINLKKRFNQEELKQLLEETKDIFSKSTFVRNTIDRTTGKTLEGGLYEVGAISFLRENSGLWFAIESSDEVLEKYVIPAIRFLQDQGIGGDHTVGFGQFKFSGRIEKIKLSVPSNANGFLNLSLILPSLSDLEKIHRFTSLSWEFVIRGGHPVFSFQKKSSFWKPQILMIKEGSILPAGVKGQILEYDTGEFTSYHFAKNFAIPISLN